MIALGKIKEAEQLLAEGKLSHRKIAATIGISRSTIGAIAAGRRPDYEARQRAREEEAARPLGPPARCAQCGGMVYMPCRLCRVRQLKAGERQRLRTLRRQSREQALLRLLVAVREANQWADALEAEKDHFAAAEAGGASDCK